MWTVIGRRLEAPGAGIAERVLSARIATARSSACTMAAVPERSRRRADVEAVRRIVPALLEKGYHFETVSQLCMPDLMQTDELTQRVLRIIAETQRKDPAQVTIDSSFEELGIDSMDGVNIVFALENEFNINVPDEEVKNIRSVRDMVEGVRRLCGAS